MGNLFQMHIKLILIVLFYYNTNNDSNKNENYMMALFKSHTPVLITLRGTQSILTRYDFIKNIAFIKSRVSSSAGAAAAVALGHNTSQPTVAVMDNWSQKYYTLWHWLCLDVFVCVCISLYPDVLVRSGRSTSLKMQLF